MKLLPLYPGAQPCVGSGLCCKTAACEYGERTSDTDPGCRHLVEVGDIYRCGIIEEILEKPGWEVSPAFGAGCCMSLFNANRERILRNQCSS